MRRIYTPSTAVIAEINQIELNKRLYMDEATLAKKPDFGTLQRDLHALLEALAAWVR